MANGRRRRVKFTDKKHAKKGIASSALALVSLLSMVGLVVDTSLARGNAGREVGLFGFLSIVIAVFGLILGITSYKEQERYYLFSGIGTAMNAFLLILWLSIYIRGFYGL